MYEIIGKVTGHRLSKDEEEIFSIVEFRNPLFPDSTIGQEIVIPERFAVGTKVSVSVSQRS